MTDQPRRYAGYDEGERRYEMAPPRDIADAFVDAMANTDFMRTVFAQGTVRDPHRFFKALGLNKRVRPLWEQKLIPLGMLRTGNATYFEAWHERH